MRFELIVSSSIGRHPFQKPIRGCLRTYKSFRAAKQALAWARKQFIFSKEYYEIYLEKHWWESWKEPVILPAGKNQ